MKVLFMHIPQLTLVDIGGLVSKENKEICEEATHVVILAGDDPEQQENLERSNGTMAEICKGTRFNSL